MVDKVVIRRDAYLYAIIVDSEIKYVGKGTGDRKDHHVKHAKDINRRRANGVKVITSPFYNKLAKAIRDNSVIEVFVLLDGLTDNEAYYWETVEIAERGLFSLWNTFEGGKGITSDGAVRRWKDPTYRKNQEAANARPETKLNRSLAAKLSQNDPEVCAKRTHSQKLAFAKPESKAKKKKALEDCWSRADYREKSIKARQENFEDPEFWAKQSALRKEQWTRPGYRERTSAAISAGKARAKQKKLELDNA